MVARIDLGQRAIGGTGLSVSAPGQDVTSAAARLLFSSDARYAQVFFEGQLALTVRQYTAQEAPPLDPTNKVTYYYTQGYGRWLFPRALPFKPYCRLTFTFLEDDAQRYNLGTGSVGLAYDIQRSITLRFAPATDSVEVFYTFFRRAQGYLANVAVKIAVLNIPVDQ